MDILKILKTFCVQNNELYLEMMSPYDGGDGYVYGCDNSMFLAVPDTYEGIPMGLPMNQKKAALQRCLLGETVEPFPIPIQTILDVAKKFSEKAKCGECKGTGKVRYVFMDSDDEPHYKSLECPCCNGTGIAHGNLVVIHPDTQKPIDDTVYVEIDHGTRVKFNLARLTIVALAAKEFDLDAIEVTNFAPNRAAIFKFPDGILAGLMPCMEGTNVQAKINVQ